MFKIVKIQRSLFACFIMVLFCIPSEYRIDEMIFAAHTYTIEICLFDKNPHVFALKVKYELLFWKYEFQFKISHQMIGFRLALCSIFVFFDSLRGCLFLMFGIKPFLVITKHIHFKKIKNNKKTSKSDILI